MKKILIINGNPRKDSFSDAIALRYKNGAGDSCKILNLHELNFDPVLHTGYKSQQNMEQDLIQAQQLISEAEHIVWVFPIWWGEMPALLKGFIDRVFLPGFAFKYKKDSPMWDKLLKGRSTELIVTMDAPVWHHVLFNRSHGTKAFKKFTLEFCGFRFLGTTRMGSMRFSNEQMRELFLNKVQTLARKRSA
ncbi:MAG: NAD(P)H-dependent oxidoreductase [Flavobacteriales bacterium]|nr:NAD(P)H-dependent oxidoreductase [Flavobacteriales bacterium]